MSDREETKRTEKTGYPPGFDIAPSKDPSITSLLTQEYAEDEYDPLLGGESIDLDPEGEYISLLSDEASLTFSDVYTPEYESLEASTVTGHTSS